MADLTDLIAAHTRLGAAMDNKCVCSCSWIGHYVDHPAHVALVVEQHTNGRMAELRATLRDEAPYAARGHAMDDPDISNCGDSECPGCEYDDDALRAEKAEATVARVITALEAAEKSVPDDWGVTYIYTSQLRAALEGEQQ